MWVNIENRLRIEPRITLSRIITKATHEKFTPIIFRTRWMNCIRFPLIKFLGFFACWLVDSNICCQMVKLVENTISKLNVYIFCTKQATLSNRWFRIIFSGLMLRRKNIKIPVVLIVHFDIEQWSCSLLHVNLLIFLSFSFVSIIMYTSEHTHSVLQESDQTQWT